MSCYRTNLRALRELQQRIGGVYIDEHTPPYYRVPYACHVTGIDDETNSCQGPHYTLQHEWAAQAIFDRVYKARAEPVVNWRFNVIDHTGLVLTVTPIYEPKERAIQDMITPFRDGERAMWTRAQAEDLHRIEHGGSNWAMTFDFLLRVLNPATHQTVHGYLESADYAYTHMLDPDLAQPVLDTLWAATQGDPRAFAGATHCAFCAHPLSDALSSARGYGPDCAKRYRLPWLKVASNTDATNIGVSP